MSVDCLVLKIEEVETVIKMIQGVETIKKEVDTTLYILYDTLKEKYIIRGKRKDLTNKSSKDYSFETDCEKKLVGFLKYVICKKNKANHILYNCNCLPKLSNDITFDFFDGILTNVNEISGFDDQPFDRKWMLYTLRLLKNIHNDYF
jgi:hypothetical protein